MIKSFTKRTRLCFGLFVTFSLTFTVWGLTSLEILPWALRHAEPRDQERFAITRAGKDQTVEIKQKFRYLSYDVKTTAAHEFSFLKVDMAALKYMPFLYMVHELKKVRNRPECMKVATDPKSYWRSQPLNGSLKTSETDIARMAIAFECGVLDQEYLTTPLIDRLYPFEKFYLSEPPLVDIKDASNEMLSICTLYNSSLTFKVGDTVALKIEMRDGRGNPKLKGGDQIRVWLEDYKNHSSMAANVKDLNNGTYLATAPLPWAGKLRLRVALAYPREYLRAVLYMFHVLKASRPIVAVYRNNLASEATPCYHTQVVPGFNQSELCNFTKVNGAPWFCGHPIKSQLNCSDYFGTNAMNLQGNHPVTNGEIKMLQRSCREPFVRDFPVKMELTVLPGHTNIRPTLPCNKVLPQATWGQEAPTGYLSRGKWFPLSCYFSKPDYSKCFRNRTILIFGDSNGRFHYYNIRKASKCVEILKALTKAWHNPLLCVHKGNNFTVKWNPHSNPFITNKVEKVGSLIPTANAIDEIPSHGQYLIILNHYFHLSTRHFSAFDFMYRSIKDALVRLFKRNPHVQVVLQIPHIAWKGWYSQHYAAGDTFGTNMMDLQREIFDDIKDKVVVIYAWDLTIAAVSHGHHPAVNNIIFDVIAGFMCGR